MSEQYQRFKQNFFRQHPPSTTQQKVSQQYASSTYKSYDPHGQFTGAGKQPFRSPSDDNLRIENQSHFPFEQIEHATFNDLSQDGFLPVGQNNTNQISKSKQNQNQYLPQQKYSVNREYPEMQIPTRTQSKFEYRTVQRQPDFYEENNLRGGLLQRAEIDRINEEIQNLRIRKTANFYSPESNRSQDEEQDSKRYMPEELYQQPYQQRTQVRPQSYSVKKQYVVEGRSQNQPNVEQTKHLPVIYNKPNVLVNSSHKLVPPAQPLSPHGSRVIIQQSPSSFQGPQIVPSQSQIQGLQPEMRQGPVNLIPSQNMIPGVSSNSRVIIHTESVGQSKGMIVSSGNIPPGHINSPPMISSQHPQLIQQPIQIVENPKQGMVPLKQYERLRNECAMWQQRFYQANDQLTRVQSSQGNFQTQETLLLRQENRRLIEKLQNLESSQKSSYEKIKSSYEDLLKKYQDSLMKECNLLVDRFRLEMKHNERY